jgi:hypothetical protein
MPGNAAVREGVRHLDGWLVALWLRSPVGVDGIGPAARARRRRSQAQEHPTDHVGPQRGVVTCDLDPAADSFTFTRWGRPPVRLQFAQVAMWEPVSPPPPAPLPVEDVARP